MSRRQVFSRGLIGLCGVWMVGLGAYFILVRPPLLPEDVRYIGLNPDDIERQLPGLKSWLGHVFTVMGDHALRVQPRADRLPRQLARHRVAVARHGDQAGAAHARDVLHVTIEVHGLGHQVAALQLQHLGHAEGLVLGVAQLGPQRLAALAQP